MANHTKQNYGSGDELKSPGTIIAENREKVKNEFVHNISRKESRKQSHDAGEDAMAKLDRKEGEKPPQQQEGEEEVKAKESQKTSDESSGVQSQSATASNTTTDVSAASSSTQEKTSPTIHQTIPSPKQAKSNAPAVTFASSSSHSLTASDDYIPPTKGSKISGEMVNSGVKLYIHWAGHLSGMLDDEEFTDCSIQVGLFSLHGMLFCIRQLPVPGGGGEGEGPQVCPGAIFASAA